MNYQYNKIGVIENDFLDLAFSFMQVDETGKPFAVNAPIEFVDLPEPGTFNFGRHLSVPKKEGQRLMDRLYYLGIRPEKVDIEIGAIPAMKAHIKDLQAEIAFLRTIVGQI